MVQEIFTWIARTSSIKKGQVGLKEWILRPCSNSNSQKQILGEYRVSTVQCCLSSL